MADLSRIPLVALSIETKTLVSTLLNPTKWIPTDAGLPRDWRGFAHLCDLGGETIPSLSAHADPVGRIIQIIENKKSCSTLEDFESLLSNIDRWDVIDDAHSLLVRDAEKYLERLERCGTNAGELDAETEKQVLTIDDLYRFRQGLDKQCYDGFLLYSEEDMEFVTEMIDNLEKKHNLKLCIKDRDLIGGLTFEHEAVMQLISERCNRLIVVISPNFLKSPANKFFLNYAQAVGIEMRQRKIIPCLYKKCQLPPQLSYTFILDYSRGGLYDFWGRLSDSVKVVAVENASNGHLPTQQSRRWYDEKSVGIKMIEDANGHLPTQQSSRWNDEKSVGMNEDDKECERSLANATVIALERRKVGRDEDDKECELVQFHLPTQQSSRWNDEKSVGMKMIEDVQSVTIDEKYSEATDGSWRTCASVSSEKLVKQKKTRNFIPWPKRKRDRNPKNRDKETESATETMSVSISLPSLDDLPPLDIMESTSSNKSTTKRKKNLVGTCVKKVQSLLSKS